MPTPPIVMEAVFKERGRNLTLRFSPEGVDWLSPSTAVRSPLADTLQQFKIDKRPIKRILDRNRRMSRGHVCV
jgi:hypothetical protein